MELFFWQNMMLNYPPEVNLNLTALEYDITFELDTTDLDPHYQYLKEK